MAQDRSTPEKTFALDWIDGHMGDLSDWNQTIWHYAEPALREYKSAAWYVARLRQEGFEVEAGSGGMPTAFSATALSTPAFAASRSVSSSISAPYPPVDCRIVVMKFILSACDANYKRCGFSKRPFT